MVMSRRTRSSSVIPYILVLLIFIFVSEVRVRGIGRVGIAAPSTPCVNRCSIVGTIVEEVGRRRIWNGVGVGVMGVRMGAEARC